MAMTGAATTAAATMAAVTPGVSDIERPLASNDAVPDDDLSTRALTALSRLQPAEDGEMAALIEELLDDRESMRRQLVRLGYDMHDGPLQALAAAAADLRHFQSQLETFLHGQKDANKLLGRVDDLVARELALGEQIRNLILGIDPDPLTHRPLSQVIGDIHHSFSGFAIVLHVDPAVDELELTDSQRITVVRVVRGALDNVERHSGASTATVTIKAEKGAIEAVVTDDGRGFDPSSPAAARSIGLTAMRERVALLRGDFSIQSKPGGPTSVRVRLTPWRQPAG